MGADEREGMCLPLTVNGIGELRAAAGADLGHSEWLEVTRERVDMFADATGDHQWIHVDERRARSGPFGGTIAHGYLTVSLLAALFPELLVINGFGMGINYGLNRVRFPAPVPVGATVRRTGRVASVQEVRGDGVEVVADLTIEIAGRDKPACVAQALYRYYP